MNDATKELGKAFEYGLTAAGRKLVWLLFLAWLATMGLYWWSGKFDYDSTDLGSKRSGLALYVDNATGCHYLGNERGGMTPRLDRAGQHLCSGHE